MLYRPQRSDFVVSQNNFTLGIDNETHIEEAILKIRMLGFSLRHDEAIPFARQFADFFGFFSGDVNGTFPREFHVIEVEHFIVECLQGAFRNGDQTHGKTEAGKPTGSFDQVLQVFDVYLDVFAGANAANCGDQANGGVGFDHFRDS